MQTHLHKLGVLIGHTKTCATLCGKRVTATAMAQNGQEATCVECRAERLKKYRGYGELILTYAASGFARAELLAEAKSVVSAGPRYTNAEILR